MANLSSFLGSIFNSYNKNKLKEFQSIVKKINDVEDNYEGKNQSELIQFTEQLKKDFSNGTDLDDLIVPAFALVREAAKQTLKQRHFDVQLLGGLVLHSGAIAEMKTGEGKTLVSTLPAFLNALTGNGVHIVTVNEYLAKRDSEWMGKIFNYLGLTVGCISSEIKTNEERNKLVASNGSKSLKYKESELKNYMKSNKIKILIDLGVGKSNAKMITCDYSYDYIRINASYKT
ncbi:bifunctional ornithine acetyltransferase/N-acetylglutamate synthase [Pelagibacteraceae bacterium]|nr:bifunctional ornithine acetyltransferase/N-acetylglutamate synthase [Pelagibacteraceae bacterium]